MKFSTFVSNVQGWQRDKGIYDHSTPLAQALKAVSEMGELADAVIKGDRAGIKDGIGDVMVCLVGVATMRSVECDFEVSINPTTVSTSAAAVQEAVASAAVAVGVVAVTVSGQDPYLAMHMAASATALIRVAMLTGMDFEDCCEAAWMEIKDRKGRMVEGGAFVKDEQVDLSKRNAENSPTLRDQFAMAVLPAVYTKRSASFTALARESYKVADAMLAERA